jgi:hypothetical protein
MGTIPGSAAAILDGDLFFFARNKLRGVRFAFVEDQPYERITVHLLEQLQLLIRPRQNCDTELIAGARCLAPMWHKVATWSQSAPISR